MEDKDKWSTSNRGTQRLSQFNHTSVRDSLHSGLSSFHLRNHLPSELTKKRTSQALNHKSSTTPYSESFIFNLLSSISNPSSADIKDSLEQLLAISRSSTHSTTLFKFDPLSVFLPLLTTGDDIIKWNILSIISELLANGNPSQIIQIAHSGLVPILDTILRSNLSLSVRYRALLCVYNASLESFDLTLMILRTSIPFTLLSYIIDSLSAYTDTPTTTSSILPSETPITASHVTVAISFLEGHKVYRKPCSKEENSFLYLCIGAISSFIDALADETSDQSTPDEISVFIPLLLQTRSLLLLFYPDSTSFFPNDSASMTSENLQASVLSIIYFICSTKPLHSIVCTHFHYPHKHISLSLYPSIYLSISLSLYIFYTLVSS